MSPNVNTDHQHRSDRKSPNARLHGIEHTVTMWSCHVVCVFIICVHKCPWMRFPCNLFLVINRKYTAHSWYNQLLILSHFPPLAESLSRNQPSKQHRPNRFVCPVRYLFFFEPVQIRKHVFHVLATDKMNSSCTSGYILQPIRWQVGFKHITGNSSKTETETHFFADRVSWHHQDGCFISY